jgi:hypothetical protein
MLNYDGCNNAAEANDFPRNLCCLPMRCDIFCWKLCFIEDSVPADDDLPSVGTPDAVSLLDVAVPNENILISAKIQFMTSFFWNMIPCLTPECSQVAEVGNLAAKCFIRSFKI